MKKKILIIGSSGYLGNKLKKNLKNKYKLISPSKKKIDIVNFDKIKKYFEIDPDLIINLSGQISANTKQMKNTILQGNKNLIKLCKNKKTKIFFLSTSLIYGYSKKELIENSNKNPVDNYSKFKLMAEREYQKSNINYIILRLCNIYNGKKNGIVKILINSIKKNKRIQLTNKNVYRNYIHIDDAVNILSKMIEKNLKYKVYNLGFENIKLLEIIKFLEKRLKKKINYFDKNLLLNKIPSQKIYLGRIFNEIKYKPKKDIRTYILKKYLNEFKFS